MPNTEIEAQYYSKLLMLTGAALVESGFDPTSTTPVNPANIKPNTSAVRALYTEMLDKARLRPVDMPDLRGDATKIHEHTGWKPKLNIQDTLKAMLEDWDRKIAAA